MNSNQRVYDVVIVGAGFAGLQLARLLSKNYKVCIIDKKKDLIGELNTTGSTLYNKKDDIFTLFGFPERLIITKYNSMSIQSKNEKVTTDIGAFPWVLLDIPALRKYIIENIDASASIVLNCEVVEIIENNDAYEGVIICNVTNGEKSVVRGKVIIDASGSSVALASKVKMKIPRYKSQCYQIDAIIDSEIDDAHVQMFVGHAFCPKGYAYIFPINRNKVRMGVNSIGSLTKSPLGVEDLFADFLKYLEANVRGIENEVKIEVFTGGINKNNSKNNLLVIGDAAGYISPFVGEGIRFAFHSAEITNSLIKEYLYEGNMSVFKKYYSLWEKRFGKMFWLSHYLQCILLHINDNLIDRFISKLKKASVREPNLVFRLIATKNTFFETMRSLT